MLPGLSPPIAGRIPCAARRYAISARLHGLTTHVQVTRAIPPANR